MDLSMGLSSAIDWWDEWKLRILVLCSLFVHSFQFFSYYVRKWYALRKLRVLVWIAYIGGDALAIYALATLFNREKQHTVAVDGGGGSALEVTWAPVLLIHLGGQHAISAYSLEDNELWKRLAITLVSQVAVALYVFCKWWSGEKRLLHGAILLFTAGILRFSLKPWALRRASYGGMASTYLSHPPRRDEEESCSWWSWLGRGCTAICTTNLHNILAKLDEKLGGAQLENNRSTVGKGINYSLEEYVKEAQKCVTEGRQITGEAQLKKFKKDRALVSEDIYKMFLDLAAPYSVRLYYLQSFLNLDGDKQHKGLRHLIKLQFRATYTKYRSAATCIGIFTFLMLDSLPLASLVLFAKSDKDGYDKRDITVTYILFCGTVAMELAPLFIDYLCHSLFRWNLLSRPIYWQDMVAQHNIMSFCARKKKPPTLMKLATFSILRDYINKHQYIWHKPVAQQISMLVRQHAEEDGWTKKYVQDAATYRRFNNLRGERTLMKMNLNLLEHDKLGWTFHLPFDQYVLLWHLATDLCIHQTTDVDASQGAISSRRSSKIISNYMIYLLFICPEMLISGARHDLFIMTCRDIERTIKDQPLPSLDERNIAQRVFCCMEQEVDECMRQSGVISDAYRLAKALIDFDNDTDTEMWEVIQGVWVEMLCYSASRCRGYLHVKGLGVAGEFVTSVWLLWWCMGMQTLPDMLNNLGPPEELTAAASV